ETSDATELPAVDRSGGGRLDDARERGLRDGESRDRHGLPVRPDRGDADGRRQHVPGRSRLRPPRQRQGRRRGAQDQADRDRSRVQGAGREPMSVSEDLLAQEWFQLKTFAGPRPGVEMGAQVLDIAQRYHADFVIAHLFGRSPSVSIKEFKRVGYPLRKVVSFVWGSAEADVEAAGGWSAAEGYHVMQFAGVGTDYPVLNEIRQMYKKEGKPAPKEMASTVYYNRGVVWAAVQVEAVRNALKAKPDGRITGEDVKRGFEKIASFTLGGLVPPL